MMAPNDNGSMITVSVPVCSFRKGYAREYLETEDIPPPSTVYGFLLSLTGEEDRYKHIGTEFSYALLNKPELSVVLRTAWRVKNKNVPPGIGNNKRPDFREILTGLKLAVWIKNGELAEKIACAGSDPLKISRFGSLSLGESHDLIDEIHWSPTLDGLNGHWLVHDPEGEYPLPIWVDHVGSKNTIRKQFSLLVKPLERPEDNDPRWIKIEKSK